MLSDLVRSAVTLTLMLAVGVGIGFRPQTGLGGLLAALAVGLLFGYAWSWVMALVGLVVRSAEAVQAVVYMVVFALAFTSSVFVPTQTMPAWLQPFAANQPVTVATNALRGLVLGQGALPPGRTVAGQVALALLWATAITAVFAPLAVRTYRRTSADTPPGSCSVLGVRKVVELHHRGCFHQESLPVVWPTSIR